MRLLVMSDSHNNIGAMLYAAQKACPDAIVHLGDHIGDAQQLRLSLPNMVFYMVKGNCDYLDSGDIELFMTIEGVKVLMAHGHKHNVKSGLGSLIRHSQERGAQLTLYGHTHSAAAGQVGGLTLMCPGQMERHDKHQTASYGIVDIENGSFQCWLETLPLSQK